jgi:hypothetical protein
VYLNQVETCLLFRNSDLLAGEEVSVMTARVVRDWRGIKFKTSECSTAELMALRANTVQVQIQVERFLGEIDTELVDRALIPWAEAGSDRLVSSTSTSNQMSAVSAAP